MEHNLHATDDRLEEYVLGRLPHTELVSLEEHLMVCADCQERLNAFEDFASGIKEAFEAESKTLPASASRIAVAPRMAWFGWSFPSLFRPVFSIAIGLAALMIVALIVSNGRTKLAPSAALQLTAMRGEMALTIPAREFDLTLSGTPSDGGPFRVEVVNAMGESIWTGAAARSQAGVQIKLMQSLKPGDYFVRLYDSAGKSVREYGFRVRD